MTAPTDATAPATHWPPTGPDDGAALTLLYDRFRQKCPETASVEELQEAVDKIPEDERPADPDRPLVAIPPPTHSPDFSVFNWGSVLLPFGPKQRRAAAALWSAAESRTHLLGGAYLLGVAGARGRMRDLFRGHIGWGTLILGNEQHGQGAGLYRLAPGPIIGLVRGRGMFG